MCRIFTNTYTIVPIVPGEIPGILYTWVNHGFYQLDVLAVGVIAGNYRTKSQSPRGSRGWGGGGYMVTNDWW